MNSLSYKDAGVDLELYQQAMQRLPALMQSTHAAQKGRVMDLPGGFAGLFRLNGGGRRYEDPVLVSGTDGVGTKIKVAIMAGVHNTVGIDLVAMCVNDCLCLGAEPLFFLDYLALGKDNPPLIGSLVEGVSAGCRLAGAALLGGETAIMPDLYAEGDFDLAGFCVGVVERSRVVDGREIRAGDVVIGLESSGLHSNGFSLVRKVVFERAGLTIDAHIPELGKTVAEALLEPTRIYAAGIVDVMHHPRGTIGVSGIAHITGGGLAENLERILPEGRRVKINRGSWPVPPIFGWLDRLGNIGEAEMARVFNMGIGLVLTVKPLQADNIREQLAGHGYVSHVIGKVVEGDRGVEFVE